MARSSREPPVDLVLAAVHVHGPAGGLDGGRLCPRPELRPRRGYKQGEGAPHEPRADRGWAGRRPVDRPEEPRRAYRRGGTSGGGRGPSDSPFAPAQGCPSNCLHRGRARIGLAVERGVPYLFRLRALSHEPVDDYEVDRVLHPVRRIDCRRVPALEGEERAAVAAGRAIGAHRRPSLCAWLWEACGPSLPR